jgi:undecaprenyl pyrophosphate phosphatase UppP
MNDEKIENEIENDELETDEEEEGILEERSEVEKEQGKWFMDVAKYVITAFVFAFVFDDIENKTVAYTVAISIAAVTYMGGVWLLKLKKKKKTKNKRKKKKNNQKKKN